MRPSDIDIQFVAVEQVRPLRHRLLRPHQPLDATIYPGDDAPSARHAVALVRDEITGIGSVLPETPPGEEASAAWRLRGMAVVDSWRGRGIGRVLIEALQEYVQSQGGSLIWCDARTSAVPFYEAAGFRVEGEERDTPPLGPHVYMRWYPHEEGS